MNDRINTTARIGTESGSSTKKCLPRSCAIQRGGLFQRAVDSLRAAFNRPDMQRNAAKIGEDHAAMRIRRPINGMYCPVRSNNAYSATRDKTAGNIWEKSASL